VPRIVIRGVRSRAFPDVDQFTDARAVPRANVSRNRDRRGSGIHEQRCQFEPGCEQTLADDGTGAEHGGMSATRFHGPQRGLGHELVSPGFWQDEVEAGGSTCVRELNRSCGERFDQRIIPDDDNG
jgi:hypothetical protein